MKEAIIWVLGVVLGLSIGGYFGHENGYNEAEQRCVELMLESLE